MELYELQWIQTAAVIMFLLAASFILRKIVDRLTRKFNFAVERKNIILKTFNFLVVLIAFIAISAIWSVDPSELFIFLTSVMTILGIAFFAQWSILSNITSGLILFFNHPLRIGGPIKILDKDYPIEGQIENISLFFLYIKTTDGAIITIPTSVVLSKVIYVNFREGEKPEEKYED